MKSRVTIFFIFLSIQVFGQKDSSVKISPSHVLDGVYIPEHLPNRQQRKNQNLAINYIIPELKDSIRFAKLISKAKYFKTYYSQKPLEIKDAVYFSQMSELVFDTVKNYNKSIFFINADTNQLHRHKVLPSSLRFYCDSAWLEKDKEDSLSPWQINARVILPMENYLRPFYFSTHEVTNAEYREFVNWVRDSIARELLGELDADKWWNKKDKNGVERKDGGHALKWDVKLNYNDTNEVVRETLNELYLPVKKRFYRTKEFDTRKLNYYYNKKVPIVNVYPDTLCWVHDFTYSFNEPMTNNYFWHPVYNDYPVVGVSYPQVIAFLCWKTKMKQQEFNAKGIKLNIEYDLPSEIEWDIVATAEKQNSKKKIFTENYKYLCDDSWLTDLEIENPLIIDTISDKISGSGKYYYHNWTTLTRRNFLSETIKENFGMDNNLTADNSFHTFKADLSKINSDKQDKKKKNPLLISNLDANNISFMGGNVSEWLKESYHENWKNLFKIRQELLSKIKGEDAKLLKELEKYYDTYNGRDGHLIRGANWFDERYSNKYEKNVAGMKAKRFSNNSNIPPVFWSHCTVGFRYVIHVTYKDK